MSKYSFILLLFISTYSYNVKSAEAFYPEATFFMQDNNNYFLHTVERGQTVYSIAAMYSISTEDIYSLNPDSRNVIRIGSVLKIPQESGSYLYHTIQPKETLYALSQKYQMKGEDIIAVNPGLSVETFTIGKIIRIPTNKVTSPLQGGSEDANRKKTNSLLNKNYQSETVGTIKVALILPFEEANTQNDGRMIEYYEGFLLALRDLKQKGISVDLLTFDTGIGTEALNKVLEKSEIQNVNLLIGGRHEDQIKLMSRFSKEKNIPYVIPFTSKNDETYNNPNVYQVNPPQSNLYSKASLAFINKYQNNNIIVASVEAAASSQADFIKVLKDDLNDKKIPFKTIALDTDFYNKLNAQLSKEKRNVIIPTDDSAETLSRLTALLKTAADSHPDFRFALFGYPNWQVHIARFSDSSDDFFRLNTSFYTLFYTNPTAPEVKLFYNTFYKWYGKSLTNMFPKFGILGYDTGMYFIQVVNAFGTQFHSRANELKYKGIQIDFNFKRVTNWGGFVNTNLYVVDYNQDYSISKSLVK
ncbi:MAG: LysM peptidoglycan-binding domain-containing protein [Dysgonamonadaceae bacterium]|jgi:LysM repeat protein|nr:LysM peptidoglycan-binding domain-containing protein [Dysgonamonadaceae bacterium]